MTTKEKLAQIKKKIKHYTPEIIVVASATVGIGVTVHALKNATKAALGDEDFALPTITGEEKKTILGRSDTILQQIEDDLYFLSTGVTKTED